MSAPPFTRLKAVAVPLIRPNIDTDAIIPSREIKGVSKTGLRDGLFAGWRYRTIGGREPDSAFVLNNPAYAGAQILIGGSNFGCGSSREHAVWALAEYGFRVVIAPSFNPIFRNNCIRNGIVPLTLPEDRVQSLAGVVTADPQRFRVDVDLEAQTVAAPDGRVMAFEIAGEAKEMLLHGLDSIDVTLRRRAEIEKFQAADRARRPWAHL